MAHIDGELVSRIKTIVAEAKENPGLGADFESKVEEWDKLLNGKRSNESNEESTDNPTQQLRQEPRQRRGAGIFKIGGLFLFLTLYSIACYYFLLPHLSPTLDNIVSTSQTNLIEPIPPVTMSSTEQT